MSFYTWGSMSTLVLMLASERFRNIVSIYWKVTESRIRAFINCFITTGFTWNDSVNTFPSIQDESHFTFFSPGVGSLCTFFVPLNLCSSILHIFVAYSILNVAYYPPRVGNVLGSEHTHGGGLPLPSSQQSLSWARQECFIYITEQSKYSTILMLYSTWKKKVWLKKNLSYLQARVCMSYSKQYVAPGDLSWSLTVTPNVCFLCVTKFDKAFYGF